MRQFHPRKHLSDLVQPYALRAPEVVLGLEWGPAIDIWSLGCLMYEWATSNWLFSPEGRDGVSRDLMHLAQMSERTGQHHIRTVLSEATVQCNSAEEVHAYISLMLRFLKLNPVERATAAEALDESVFEHL
ncbi:kinase-like protein [Phlegmacium glaucopus]|nr:kinase-like protein [Phlegmacium glaucopus]